jgi:diguanylate cyclase
LRVIAGFVTSMVSSSHLVCRLGGEEFVVIFSQANVEDVIEIAERLRVTIQEARIDFAGLKLSVTVSTGLAQFLPGESVSSLIGRTDAALYASKSAGRNCGHLHDGRRLGPLLDWPMGASQILDVAEHSWEPEVGISTPAAFRHDMRNRINDFQDGVAPLSMLSIQLDDIPTEICRDVEQVRQAGTRAVTLMIKGVMREMDHAARFEQDAFSVLLPGCTLKGAVTIAERLRTAIAGCELPARHDRRHVTVSLGVAEIKAGETEEQLIDRARQSLALARAQGPNRTCIHDGVDSRPLGTAGAVMVGG